MRMEDNWQKDLRNALELIAPGTVIREGVENILRAHTGGLLVIGDGPDVRNIVEGGFLINEELNEARLYELAKMDGAIILDEKGEHIWRANAQLQPLSELKSDETGIRHRVAARTAAQTGAIVIAVSQRRSMVTIYLGRRKFILSDIGTLLMKANQALQTLERYCQELKKELDNLSVLEFDDMVLVNDVVKVVQRGERVKRISNELEFYLLQMGEDGKLIRMQMDEVTSDLGTESQSIFFNYTENPDKKSVLELERRLEELDDEDLMDKTYIAKLLGLGTGSDLLERPLSTRGYRILSRVPRLPAPIIHNIVEYFGGDLQQIVKASIEELDDVEGIGTVRSNAIHRSLLRQREYANSHLVKL